MALATPYGRIAQLVERWSLKPGQRGFEPHYDHMKFIFLIIFYFIFHFSFSQDGIYKVSYFVKCKDINEIDYVKWAKAAEDDSIIIDNKKIIFCLFNIKNTFEINKKYGSSYYHDEVVIKNKRIVNNENLISIEFNNMNLCYCFICKRKRYAVH